MNMVSVLRRRPGSARSLHTSPIGIVLRLSILCLILLSLTPFVSADPIAPFSSWKMVYYSGSQFSDGTSDDLTICPNRLSNLMNYALNLAPTQDASAALPTGSIQDGFLTLTVTEVASAPDLDYEVEVSPDLVNWESNDGEDEGSIALLSSTLNSDGTQTMVFQDLLPASSSTNRFIRLRVYRIFDSSNSYGIPDDYLLATYGSAAAVYADLAATTFDPSGSGLPIWWEMTYFGTTGIDPNADSTTPGLSVMDTFQNGVDPTFSLVGGGSGGGGGSVTPVIDSVRSNPSAPTGLTVTQQNAQETDSQSTIDNVLSWTNTATDATAIVVERRAALGVPYTTPTFTPAKVPAPGTDGWEYVTTLGATETTYTDTVIVASASGAGKPSVHFIPQIYWYRVKSAKDTPDDNYLTGGLSTTIYGVSTVAGSDSVRIGISYLDGTSDITGTISFDDPVNISAAAPPIAGYPPVAVPNPWGNDYWGYPFVYSSPVTPPATYFQSLPYTVAFTVANTDYNTPYITFSNTPYYLHTSASTAIDDPYADTSPGGYIVVYPTQIRVFKGTTEAPSTGLVALVSDTLTFKACDPDGNVTQLNDTRVVWKTKQLLTNGVPDTVTAEAPVWDDWKYAGTGNTLSYQPAAGGIYLLKAEFYGGDGSGDGGYSILFRRTVDGEFSDARQTDKAGQPECIGICDAQWQIDLRNCALAWLGSTNFKKGASFPTGASNDNKWKCSLFVQTMIQSAGLAVPFTSGTINRQGPSANQWAGLQSTMMLIDTENIQYWSPAFKDEPPQPGYVMAHPFRPGLGHCGIVDYNGWPIAAGEFVVHKEDFAEDGFFNGESKYRSYIGP